MHSYEENDLKNKEIRASAYTPQSHKPPTPKPNPLLPTLVLDWVVQLDWLIWVKVSNVGISSFSHMNFQK